MVWLSAFASDGSVYYFDEDTGTRSWQPPSNQIGQVRCVGKAQEGHANLVKGGQREVAGTISAKIDDMLMRLPLCCGCRLINPYWLRPWISEADRSAPSCYDVCSWPRRLLGSLVYGVLFVPFISAVSRPVG